MRIRSSGWTAVLTLCIAAAATAALVFVLVRDKHEQVPGTAANRAVTIPAAGGVTLSGHVYAPTGDGPYPLVVMPGSWGSPATEYGAVATGFAELGYVVISYAQRGFHDSGGAADFAGPTTRKDVSAVIDWARAHTAAGDGGAAVVGASYGAGVALLAAEHDPRIKAVVAISGWADFARSIAPGNTIDYTDYRLLFTNTIAHTPLAPQLRTLVTQLAARRTAAALATLRAMSPVRSPIDGVASLNKNKTAVMLASTYQDSLAPPTDLVDLYEKLTGPKRLELGTGDHGATALPGLYGQKSPLWVNVAKWVARYIDGQKTGIDGQKPVQLADSNSRATHSYGSWSAVGRPLTLALGAASGTPATGSLSDTTPGTWTESISAGVPTVADAGPTQILSGRPYRVPTTSLAGVSRSAGAVWSAAPADAATLINGEPRLHLTVVSSAASASMFAYLYDVDANGAGKLITYGVETPPATGLRSGEPVDVTFAPISWTVPAGDHLALVIDSVDARYLGRSVPGSTIILSSSAADPATLTVSVG